MSYTCLRNDSTEKWLDKRRLSASSFSLHSLEIWKFKSKFALVIRTARRQLARWASRLILDNIPRYVDGNRLPTFLLKILPIQLFPIKQLSICSTKNPLAHSSQNVFTPFCGNLTSCVNFFPDGPIQNLLGRNEIKGYHDQCEIFFWKNYDGIMIDDVWHAFDWKAVWRKFFDCDAILFSNPLFPLKQLSICSTKNPLGHSSKPHKRSSHLSAAI